MQHCRVQKVKKMGKERLSRVGQKTKRYRGYTGVGYKRDK